MEPESDALVINGNDADSFFRRDILCFRGISGGMVSRYCRFVMEEFHPGLFCGTLHLPDPSIADGRTVCGGDGRWTFGE